MDGKKVCKTLPDHLVERIIVRIPFPAIFKARCLSKSWRARFSSIASQDDGAMKRVVSSFQKLLSERSKNWETFCPVFIGTNGDLVAYDKKTHKWREMPSVSFLSEHILRDDFDLQMDDFDLQIEGALLYASHFACGEIIYVANILTQTWKRLPLPPTSGCPVYSSKLVVTDRSSEAYKVILFCQRNLYRYDFPLFQIYDSKLNSWNCITLDFKLSYYWEEWNSVYFGGIFYVAATNLFAFDVVQGTFKELKLSYYPSHGWGYYPQLVVCNDELLMVSKDRYSGSPRVLKIDFDSLTCMDPRDAPDLISCPTSSRVMAPVGEDDHIFFGYSADGGSRMRAYNVRDDLWSPSFAPPTSSDYCDYKWIASFQPGFGTFVPV